MQLTYLEAIRQGIWEEMDRDPSVFCLGEDIGIIGGAFKVTRRFLSTAFALARHRHAHSRVRHRRVLEPRSPACAPSRNFSS